MMDFFKKLLAPKVNKETGKQESNFKGIYREDAFKGRYTEDNIRDNPAVVEGSLKMIESYFLDNKIERKIANPVNHPLNLDQVVEDGMGFKIYCKAFKLEEREAILFLAFAFSEFLITRYGFKLYTDNTPEYPLRGMTLQYDKDGAVLSLYPIEYSLKVLSYQGTFESLLEKIDEQLKDMPDVKEMIRQMNETQTKE